MLMTKMKKSRKNIEPSEVNELLKSLEQLAKKVSKRWPKGLTAVEAVRRERR